MMRPTTQQILMILAIFSFIPVGISQEGPYILIKLDGQAERANAIDYDGAAPNKDFLIQGLTIENHGYDRFDVDPYSCVVELNKIEYHHSSATYGLDSIGLTPLDRVTLRDGGVISGAVAFEVPKDTKAFSFYYYPLGEYDVVYSQEGLRNDEFQRIIISPMIRSTSSLDSYAFTINQSTRLEATGHSPNGTNGFTLNSTYNGSENLYLRKMATNGIFSSSLGPKQIAYDAYLIDGTIYKFSDGNWTQLKLLDLNGNLSRLDLVDLDELWMQDSFVSSQAEQLEKCKVDLIGLEKIDGDECYKLTVVPSIDVFTGIFSDHIYMPISFNPRDYKKLYEGSAINWTAWVTIDEYLLKKSHIEMTVELPTEFLVENNIAEDANVRAYLETDQVFYDYDSSNDIILPGEALNASSEYAAAFYVRGILFLPGVQLTPDYL